MPLDPNPTQEPLSVQDAIRRFQGWNPGKITQIGTCVIVCMRARNRITATCVDTGNTILAEITSFTLDPKKGNDFVIIDQARHRQ